MINTDNTEAQTLILGDLAPLFDEYIAVVNSVPAESPDVQVPYYDKVAADSVAAAEKKVPTSATQEQKLAAIDKARYKLTSATEHALRQEHFVGSISAFFKNVFEIQEVPLKEPEIIELSETAQAYLQIPEERRRAAKLSDGDGYYWAGTLVRFTDK